MDKEKVNQIKIIKTAESLVTDLNSADIKISQIAAKLGVTHAAIYKHFKNKQELWEAVTKKWFNLNIVSQINSINEADTPIQQLHDMLWAFINAKKKSYNQNKQMFVLNTHYVENNPYVLREILIVIYQKINNIMSWEDDDFNRAETILSAFAVFTLPSFKDTWNDPNFEERFEQMWSLVKSGIFSM